ncbi:hypothetical protein ACFVQ4_28930 [Streptomyces laurentii]|uniref:hypothetical protein n=1 Tax=Streptomyces laurentii TaxID=39478 RepID=UPI003691CD09
MTGRRGSGLTCSLVRTCFARVSDRLDLGGFRTLLTGLGKYRGDGSWGDAGEARPVGFDGVEADVAVEADSPGAGLGDEEACVLGRAVDVPRERDLDVVGQGEHRPDDGAADRLYIGHDEAAPGFAEAERVGNLSLRSEGEDETGLEGKAGKAERGRSLTNLLGGRRPQTLGPKFASVERRPGAHGGPVAVLGTDRHTALAAMGVQTEPERVAVAVEEVLRQGAIGAEEPVDRVDLLARCGCGIPPTPVIEWGELEPETTACSEDADLHDVTRTCAQVVSLDGAAHLMTVHEAAYAALDEEAVRAGLAEGGTGADRTALDVGEVTDPVAVQLVGQLPAAAAELDTAVVGVRGVLGTQAAQLVGVHRKNHRMVGAGRADHRRLDETVVGRGHRGQGDLLQDGVGREPNPFRRSCRPTVRCCHPRS